MRDARFAKLVVFVNALVPLALLTWDAARDRLGANPVEFVLHTTGMLALIFLTLSLAVTPIRKLSGKNFLSHFRRMLGLFAFFYGLLHLLTYFFFIRSMSPIVIWRDVVLHPYIAFGMACLVLMVPLAATSTNEAVKRLGALHWKRLHRLAYVAGVAGVVHYWMLVKADVTLPLAFAVTIGVLLGLRVIEAIRKRPARRRGFPVAPARGGMIALALMVLPGGAAHAENWPRFRGESAQGVSNEKDVPVEWSAEKNVAWKTPIPGQGWSSPIVWEDRVFVTSTTEDGRSCHVICVDAVNGKIVWDREVFKQETRRKEGKNSYATPTPVTDGRQVYAFFGSGSAAALDFNGNVAWTNTQHRFYSRHGLGASPIVYKDLLIMPMDGSSDGPVERVGWQIPWDKSYIVALKTSTGKTRWTGRRGMSRIAHVTPLIARVGEHDQLISGAGDVVQGFNPETGERIWSVYSRGEGVTPSPAVGGGMVFAASGFEAETIRAVRLDPSAKDDVTKTHIAWEQKRAVPTQPSLLYHDGLLFSVKENGIAACTDAKTGAQIWQERLEGAYSASPVFAAGRIYFLSENGDTTVIDASRTFKQITVNPLEPTCQASPAISGGRIFIRSDKHLFCIRSQP